MFIKWTEPKTFDGKTDFLDVSQHLHRFLRAAELSVDICFSTQNPGYQSLLALYYKESLMPDFALELHKGRVVLITRRHGTLQVQRGAVAYCDGAVHQMAFRGTPAGVAVWVDGELVIADQTPGKYCEFGYVGFATVGRGVSRDQYANYFAGEILSMSVADQALTPPAEQEENRHKPFPLFAKGMRGVENFRIPTMITTASGVTIASADARMEAPGDNPNHICRAVRISRDSGETWTQPRILFDFGGEGRTDGAAAIDGSLLYDAQTDTVLMLYSHTSAGIGSVLSTAGTGFDDAGRKRLWDKDGREYRILPDGRVCGTDGAGTEYSADAYGRLFCAGASAGSICHGADRMFRQADTSFLQIVRSTDNGETWSEPEELNPQVKEEWMKFIGAGPGIGIQIQEGPHKGRLVYPIYFSSAEARAYSSAAIYSDDHGRTWKRGASVNDGRVFRGHVIQARTVDDPDANLGECQITELPGGRLKIFLRNAMGKCTATAVSDDGAQSWHDVQPQPTLTDPECQSCILRIDHAGKPAYLFSNPACEDTRVRGTVRYSADATETWPAARLLEAGEFGYSCMTQLPDGQIGILYEGSDITLYFAKFPVAWVLDAPDGTG